MLKERLQAEEYDTRCKTCAYKKEWRAPDGKYVDKYKKPSGLWKISAQTLLPTAMFKGNRKIQW